LKIKDEKEGGHKARPYGGGFVGRWSLIGKRGRGRPSPYSGEWEGNEGNCK